MISIIIPTYNESLQIKPCLEQIVRNIDASIVEIILTDSPNSNDGLEKVAEKHSCTYLRTKKAGRNHQMNEAAAIAKGDILYFVHADVLVHSQFISDILAAIEDGADLGCYRYVFDKYPNPLLYINSFFTRFPMLWCRGGDQTLFIKKSVFQKLNGFCTEHTIMEDFDLIRRSKDKFSFNIIPKNVTVSSRKYQKNSYWKVQYANLLVMRNWLKKNTEPKELLILYQKLLKTSK